MCSAKRSAEAALKYKSKVHAGKGSLEVLPCTVELAAAVGYLKFNISRKRGRPC